MNLGKFLNENWITFWQVLLGLILIGVIALIFGGDWGIALIGFPAFAFLVGWFFKAMYVRGLKK